MPPPIVPPLEPMLGKLVRELPLGDYLYEPKWDGFRCIAFRDGDDVDLRSRNDRPLARYFPEVVEALLAVEPGRFVIDGELLVEGDDGFDFTPLLQRLHPAASRVERLRTETPATLRAFDLLALGDEDLRPLPFARRRVELDRLIPAGGSTLSPTAITSEPEIAADWLERFDGHSVDGVMAKPRDLDYQPGQRAMLKVKQVRTLDCVVAGFRLFDDRPLPSSLLLGLFDEGGMLQSIGVASSFRESLRHELLEELRPLVVPLAGHPWEAGFLVEGGPTGRLPGAATRWDPTMMELDWIPVAPVRVAEVSYDHLDNRRLRHPARFRRWRPDRDPDSCTFEQAEHEVADPRNLAGRSG
ncbi:MAG: ATP-dependent DNA ligase [Thermoleophilaceae bacterium]